MEANAASRFSPAMSDFSEEEFVEVKKGPWTAEEDALLLNYVNVHGEGRWNSVACCAGLKRTGKSCRLRWLNYLRPDLRRGNITLQEQLLILELHSRWGNRWSKIAQYLPGRTDNEIKNYWRTRVQKQAKQLKCDVNSKQFRDAMQHVWIPRLRERIQSSLANNLSSSQATDTAIHTADPRGNPAGNQVVYQMDHSGSTSFSPSFSCEVPAASSGSYSDSNRSSLASYPSERYDQQDRSCMESFTEGPWSSPWPESSLEYEGSNYYWLGDQEELMMQNLWNQENIEFLQQQLFDD